MSVSLSHRESEQGCFDVGFDRFVCCCIHLLCIRELTGRKMKICLRFSAWLFGGKCERAPHVFQIHIFLYLNKCACLPCMAINFKGSRAAWLEIIWFIPVKCKCCLLFTKLRWYCPRGGDTVRRKSSSFTYFVALVNNLVIKKWQ